MRQRLSTLALLLARCAALVASTLTLTCAGLEPVATLAMLMPADCGNSRGQSLRREEKWFRAAQNTPAILDFMA